MEIKELDEDINYYLANRHKRGVITQKDLQEKYNLSRNKLMQNIYRVLDEREKERRKGKKVMDDEELLYFLYMDEAERRRSAIETREEEDEPPHNQEVFCE